MIVRVECGEEGREAEDKISKKENLKIIEEPIKEGAKKEEVPKTDNRVGNFNEGQTGGQGYDATGKTA